MFAARESYNLYFSQLTPKWVTSFTTVHLLCGCFRPKLIPEGVVHVAQKLVPRTHVAQELAPHPPVFRKLHVASHPHMHRAAELQPGFVQSKLV
jgi:hypothetical protein